jgi:hypothetical protein
MDTTSGFLAYTVAATGAAVTQDLAHGAEGAELPSDPAWWVKSLESFLLEKRHGPSGGARRGGRCLRAPRNGARVVARAWSEDARTERDMDGSVSQTPHGKLVELNGSDHAHKRG